MTLLLAAKPYRDDEKGRELIEYAREFEGSVVFLTDENYSSVEQNPRLRRFDHRFNFDDDEPIEFYKQPEEIEVAGYVEDIDQVLSRIDYGETDVICGEFAYDIVPQETPQDTVLEETPHHGGPETVLQEKPLEDNIGLGTDLESAVDWRREYFTG